MANRDIPKPEDMPSNSYAKRNETDEDQKKITPVVSGAKIRKQGFLKRLGNAVVEDTVENAKQKAFGEIIVPGFKTLIFDTFTEMLSIMLFSEGSNGGYRPRSGSSNRRGERTSYRDYYDKKDRRGSRRDSRDIPMDPDDIIVDTRAEAHMVLDEMDHIIQKYGQASIADFYDLCQVTSEWTDNRYGWTSLRNASIKPVRDGFMLVMPRTHVLED